MPLVSHYLQSSELCRYQQFIHDPFKRTSFTRHIVRDSVRALVKGSMVDVTSSLGTLSRKFVGTPARFQYQDLHE